MSWVDENKISMNFLATLLFINVNKLAIKLLPTSILQISNPGLDPAPGNAFCTLSGILIYTAGDVC